MRYKNSWHRGAPNEEQVTWQHALPHTPSVAILGGGVSGLACAHALAKRGVRSVVFDTGEHGVGGRLGTRATRDGSLRGKGSQVPAELQAAGLAFDHAAQFARTVQQWEQEGVVRRWDGPVGLLQSGRFSALTEGGPKYVAAQGMRALAQHLEHQASLSQLVQFRRPMWVSRMAANGGEGWRLTGGKADLGTYDAVVIAHNGKCANRLVGPTGAPAVAKQLMALRLSAVWVLMAAFDQPLAVPNGFEGAFVQGSAELSWAANNTAKLQLQHQGRPGLQCWTLISTNTFAQRNKVPQEAVPADVAHKVAGEMLVAFAKALGWPAGAVPKPVFTRCQLWGAALPLNSPTVECIWDPASRVGVVGDWLLGSGVQSAVLSGQALAERIAATRAVPPGSEAEARLAIGLADPFQPLGESEIGEVAGAPPATVPPAQARAQRQRAPRGQQQQAPPPPLQQQERHQPARSAAAAASAPPVMARPTPVPAAVGTASGAAGRVQLRRPAVPR